jgi:aminoglycoside N3'-acetyltransferase
MFILSKICCSLLYYENNLALMVNLLCELCSCTKILFLNKKLKLYYLSTEVKTSLNNFIIMTNIYNCRQGTGMTSSMSCSCHYREVDYFRTQSFVLLKQFHEKKSSVPTKLVQYTKCKILKIFHGEEISRKGESQ